ncbi:hypothetical protein LY90DRAFT_707122 [Neocallimastix californiae]|jgi:hypothetical protein|uniref:Uncharacterized protein n=1 Tax=Neocallimastix californiae TaxID=1754190 RepID=A0A1Y2AIY9_9FUNG|nr:hypothetical protein LY90DRAFT_707122 [Neocallimastix californiae]|eukprot:ORY22548.1 hypothetical protein LY90DRAFT_707122 [Neocallimastix californiae]
MVLIQDILTDVKVQTPSYEMEKEYIDFTPNNQCLEKMYRRLELEKNISGLGLSLVVPLSHLDSERLYYNEDKQKNKNTKKDLVGGKEKEWYEPFQDQFYTFAASSPITTIHVATGTTIYLLKTFGVIDCDKLLYHSSKTFFPRFQLHRAVTNNFVLGQTLYEVGRRIYNLVTYGGKLEKYINGKGDTIRNKKVYIQGVQRLKEDGTVKSNSEWLLTDNKYLRMNAQMVGLIIASDYITSGLGIFTRKSKPYSILGSLEVALTFMYTLIEDESNSQFMGMFTVPPFFMPIFVGFTSGSSVYTILKGLIVGGIMASYMDIRRSDGEKVTQYLSRTSSDFWELRHLLIKTMKKIPALNVVITEIENTLARYNIYIEEVKRVVMKEPGEILNLAENIKERLIKLQNETNPGLAASSSTMNNDVIKTEISTSDDDKKKN